MRACERGLTLVEVTVAMVIASLVMVGLVGFYLSSQMTWLSASSQAVSQREGTFAIETIAHEVRGARLADVEPNPDPLHALLRLTGADTSQVTFWVSGDSILHWGTPDDRGALIQTRVIRFQLVEDDTSVDIVGLDLLDQNGQMISFVGGAAMYNRP